MSTLSDDGATVRRTVLPGGLRIVTETLPAVRSVALGIWVGVGSRDEDVRHAGATHYLEHLLFKGTKRRTALDISAEMDAVGGEMNAFTTKEYTCYYARVLDADLPLAIDILSDMVTNSVISPQDVDAERNVVLEEIAMNDDDPTDTVHEAFTAQLFGDTPLGRPVLGTVESINAITRDQIFEHYRARYSPEHLVVSAAGSLDHDDLVQQVAQAFGQALTPGVEPAPPRLSGEYADGRHSAGTGLKLVSRGIEQANLVLGCAGWPAPTTAGTPWACSTRRSAAACRPGCSRRSARSGAWPTRCTASGPRTPTPACGASTWAACRPRPTTCWPSAPARSRSWCPVG